MAASIPRIAPAPTAVSVANRPPNFCDLAIGSTSEAAILPPLGMCLSPAANGAPTPAVAAVIGSNAVSAMACAVPYPRCPGSICRIKPASAMSYFSWPVKPR